MSKINLETMSTDDLWALHEQITGILSDRITSEKRELEKRLAALGHRESLMKSGVTLKAGSSEVKFRRKYPRVYPKYRNPALPSETWSGRGKQPRWLVAALKAGHKIDEFVIKDTAEQKSGLRRA